MSEKHQRLERLCTMAALVLEQNSARLARATEARDVVLARLAALDCLPAEAGLSDLQSAQNTFAFEQWAATRRAELHLQLAAREAERLLAQEETRRAFGRNQVLKRLSKQ